MYDVDTERETVLYSKRFVTSQKSPYHVTFDLDLDLEHTLDADSSGDHRVQVWWRSSHFCGRRRDLRKSLQTDGRRTPHDCISSWNKLIIITRGRVRAGPSLQLMLTHGTHGTHTRAWRPSAAIARTDRLTRDRHDLPTSQPDNRTAAVCQYPAVSWEF